MAWNQIGTLRGNVNGRLRRRLVERQLVHDVREQLAFRLPREIRPQHRVVHRLIADVHLLRQRSFAKVQHRGTDFRTIAENVIEPRANHRLGLNREQGVAFERHFDVPAGFQQSIIDDAHPTEVVINGVILVFNQPNATCRHRHGSLRHIERIEADFAARLALEFPFDPESVERRNLLSRRLCGIVKRLENNGLDQGLGQIRILHSLHNRLPQTRAKRLRRREENPAVLAVDGPPLGRRIVHIIKDPILLGHAIDVQPVHAQQLQQQRAIERRPRDVVQIHPC